MANLPQINAGETLTGDDKVNDAIQALNGIGGDLADSGHLYQGADGPGTDAPYHRSKDSGTSGIDFRWLNDAGVVNLQLNTGTEGSPTWATVLTLDLTNRIFHFADAGDATGAEVRIYDGGADNKPGFLVLFNDGGAGSYLWKDTAGNIRIHTSKPADDDADGVILFAAGVSVADHSARHDPGGADALTTASAGTITGSNAEGTAASFARSDHNHAYGAGSVTIAALADAVQDLQCYVDWGTPGSESGDAIEIDGQVKDLAGNALAAAVVLAIRVSDTNYGAASGSATIAAKTTPLGTILEGSGTATVRVQTDANGAFGIKVSEAGAGSRYLNVSATYGTRVFLREFEDATLTFS